MRKTLLSIALLAGSISLFAQSQTDYTEPANPAATPSEAWIGVKTTIAGWGSTDVRYAKEKPVALNGITGSLTLQAWKGECVSAQAVVSAPAPIKNLNVEVSSLKGDKGSLDDCIRTAFVRYIICDELLPGNNQCGSRIASEHDSILVADPIDHLLTSMAVEARSTRPVWLSIQIPAEAKAGLYSGFVLIKDGDKIIKSLKLAVNVKNHTLPAPKDWKFHLDLWQNPYASARYHHVQPFSDEHMEILRPMMKMYADAGGKTITTSIMHKPWNGQTEDAFMSMITWIKKADGTWMYDYTAFDRWVEMMLGLGINKQISCYSMVPWRLSFRYLDQATDSFVEIKTAPGEAAYADLWGNMLRSFAQHLKEKGWFDITYIAMDERKMKDMLLTMEVIRKADPNFKIALAGSYHDELSDLDDYCITLHERYPADVLAKRKAAGKTTTFYTCCAETLPNTFTISQPAEAEWLAWHSASFALDGYLRWALNSWTKNPLHDTRFRSWTSGDTYLIYPDNRTSIRFERLKEGIQQYEKVRILREEFTQKGNKAGLKKLDEILEPFDDKNLLKTTATEMVNTAKNALNKM